MNRWDLQKISRKRLYEAKALYRTKHYDGAYYLVGYAVECAIKACIAKQVQRYDFPDKNLGAQAFSHNLDGLIQLAGLKAQLDIDMKVDRDLEINWNIVKDWKETSRYKAGTSLVNAQDMINAVSDKTHGVLQWIEKFW